MLYNVTKSKHSYSFIESAFIVTTLNHYQIARATPFGPPVAPAYGASNNV